MWRPFASPIASAIANFITFAGIFLLLWSLRATAVIVIREHPLRWAMLTICGCGTWMWHQRRMLRVLTLQRNSVIAATQSAHRHLPRLMKMGEEALPRAIADILQSYVQYYGERFRRKPGEDWEASLWRPATDEQGATYLYIAYAYGVSDKVKEQYKMGDVAPYYDGMAWQAWQTQSSIVSNRAHADPRFDNHHTQFDLKGSYPIRSIRCDIVKFEGEPYGVLVVDHSAPGMFNDTDAPFNMAYARLAGALLHAASESSRILLQGVT